MSVILFIMDGLGDDDHRFRCNKAGRVRVGTPLSLSNTPRLDRLASEGVTGMLSVHGEGVVPESEDAHLRIFGYDPKSYLPGRGPLEALGAGLRLQEGDIAFRTNFATYVNGRIVDRRAGRIDTREAHRLGRIISNITIDGIRFIFKPTVEHRGVLVLRPGRSKKNKLTDKITGNDPEHYRVKYGKVRPIGRSYESKHTAEVINRYLELVHEKLSKSSINEKRKKKGLPVANYLLLRGPGRYRRIESIKKRYGLRAVCVAGAPLYKGVARYVGMKVVDVPGATGDKHTNLKNKIDEVNRLIKSGKYDLIFLHVKATDSFSHDGDCLGKTKFLEKIDRIMGPKLVRLSKEHDIIITGDHSTPCKLKQHSADPVPIMITGPEVTPDRVKTFNERSCSKGRLGVVSGDKMITIIRALLGRVE